MLFRQLAERHRGVETVGLGQTLYGFAHQLLVALGPRRDGTVEKRLGLVGYHQARVEVVGGPKALTPGTGPVRRVERECPRGHLRHRETARHARELAREELVAG